MEEQIELENLKGDDTRTYTFEPQRQRLSKSCITCLVLTLCIIVSVISFLGSYATFKLLNGTN